MLGMEMGRHWDKTLEAVLGPGHDFPLEQGIDLTAVAAALDAAMATRTFDEWSEHFNKLDVWHA